MQRHEKENMQIGSGLERSSSLPSLAAFEARCVPSWMEPKEYVNLKSLDELSRLRPQTAEEFIAQHEPLSDSKEAREELLSDFIQSRSYENGNATSVYWEAINEFASLKGKPFSAYSYQGNTKALCNSKGEIVFSCFGQLLKQSAVFEKEFMEEARRLALLLGVEDDTPPPVGSPLVHLYAAIDTHNFNETNRNWLDEKMNTLTSPEYGQADFQLKSITHVGAFSDILAIAREACQQALGSFPEDLERALGDLVFCSQYGVHFINGREILQTLSNRLDAMGKPSDPASVRQLIETATPATVINFDSGLSPALLHLDSMPRKQKELTGLDTFLAIAREACDRLFDGVPDDLETALRNHGFFGTSRAKSYCSGEDVLEGIAEELRRRGMPRDAASVRQAIIDFQPDGGKTGAVVRHAGVFSEVGLIPEASAVPEWLAPGRTATVRALDNFKRLKPQTAEEYLAERGPIPLSIEAREQLLGDFTQSEGCENGNALFAQWEAISEFAASKGRPLQTHSYSGNDTCLCNSKGETLFSSFGLLLKHASDFEREVEEETKRLAHLLGLEPYSDDASRPVGSPLMQMVQAIDSFSREDRRGWLSTQTKTFTSPEYGQADFQLQSLEHSSLVEHAEAGLVEMVREACRQALGEFPKDLEAALGKLVFCNRTGTNFATGHEILEALASKRRETGRSGDAASIRELVRSYATGEDTNHDGSAQVYHVEGKTDFMTFKEGKHGLELTMDSQKATYVFLGETPEAPLYEEKQLQCASPRTADTPEQTLASYGDALHEACMKIAGHIPRDLKGTLSAYQFRFQDNSVMTGADLLKGMLASLQENGKQRTTAAVRKYLAEKVSNDRLERYAALVKREEFSKEDIFLALVTLGLEKDSKANYRRFEKYILRSAAKRSTGKRPSPVQVFSELVEDSVSERAAVDLSDLGKGRVRDLLKGLCYRSYDANPEEMVRELRSYQETLAKGRKTHKLLSGILDEVCPELISMFEHVSNYQDPETLKRSLFPRQREAVVGAVSFDKKLLVAGPGTGKTEIGAAYAETIFATRDPSLASALWCTIPGNREKTAYRLKHEILEGEPCVEVLKPWHVKLSPDEFKAVLESARYVVTGYNTIRDLMHKNPESYAVLQAWCKDRIKILDEGHFTDNDKSGRSKAIQGLQTEYTLVATATLVQHKPERAATILHLALPELYPDVAALRQLMKSDRNVMRALIQQHATIFNLEDIAEHFLPEDVMPFDKQLELGPRIPRRVMHEVPFKLSYEHARLYVDIATNYDTWIEARGGTGGSLSQRLHLQQLYTNPEELGASPAFSLLDAVKRIALPILERGEKVLIAGHHLAALKLVASDPELCAYNLDLLTGAVNTDERVASLDLFEEDPSHQIRVGQLDAIGSGHNCRSVNHVILLERPQLMSTFLQFLGRPVRLLTKGDERFAKEQVEYHFLYPELPSDVVESVEEPARRKCLDEGTVYRGWLDLAVAQVEDYRYLLKKGDGLPEEASSASALMEVLEKTYSRLLKNSSAFRLMSGPESRRFHSFDNPVKNAWREQALGAFVSEHLDSLGVPREELKVLLLPGPEALEIPIYLDLGIKPENVYAVEGGDRESRELCRENVLKYGCRFYGTRVERLIPMLDQEFHIVSLDLNGYITPAYFDTFRSLRLADQAMVMKNGLAQRENRVSSELIAKAGGSRNYLDAALMKLAGTRREGRPLSSHQVLQDVSFARAAAKEIVPPLSAMTGVPEERLSALFTELYLGSPHIAAYQQFSYVSPSGQPYLSTFALLRGWQEDMREGGAAAVIRGAMGDVVSRGVRPRGADFEITTGANAIAFGMPDAGRHLVTKKELLALVDYFDRAMSPEYYLSSLRNHVPGIVDVHDRPGLDALQGMAGMPHFG